MAQERFGPYQLEELIGRGGMGEVHRAVDTVRNRVVAIKRLRADLAASADFQARFRKEAALAARLNDPHVIPIHDFGEVDGRLFIDMRWVEGRDLAQLLAQDGALAPVRAAGICAQIASGIDAAHTAGLVHRDIKPSNVLVTTSAGGADFAYVADFGIARAMSGNGLATLTATGAAVGSLDYMAPERFVSGHGDRRTDIYSLGCLFYELLTARKPYPVEGLPAAIHAHINLPPPRPSEFVPGTEALDAVVARAMAKDPADRFATASDLAAAACAAVAVAPGPAAPPDPPTVVAALPGPVHGTNPDRVRPEVVPAGEPPAGPPWWPPGPRDPMSTMIGPADRPAGAPVFPGVPWQSQFLPLAPPPLPAPPVRRRRGWLIAVGVVAAVALVAGIGIVAALLLGEGDDQRLAEQRAREIVLVAATTPGPGPFGPDFTVGRGDLPVTAFVSSRPGGSGRLGAAAEGAYAGRLGASPCDRAGLSAFLAGDTLLAQAWVQAFTAEASFGWSGGRLDAGEVPAYVAEATPVLLRADTRVTAYRYADGGTEPYHAVLQAGTAVLVDVFGVPRVRCADAGPLTEARAVDDPQLTGARWPGFEPAGPLAVLPAGEQLVQFSLADVFGDPQFRRPAGSMGDRDFTESTENANLDGEYLLTGPRTGCEGLSVERCAEADQANLRVSISGCLVQQCVVTSSAWLESLPLTWDGSAWLVTGAAGEGHRYLCNEVVSPTTFALRINAASAGPIGGVWSALSIGGTYETETLPATCTGAFEAWEVSAERS